MTIKKMYILYKVDSYERVNDDEEKEATPTRGRTKIILSQ